MSPEHEDLRAEIAKKGKNIKEDFDKLLDEIDEILEENAEEFVRSYVQRPGNGGGLTVQWISEFAHGFGPRLTRRLVQFILRGEWTRENWQTEVARTFGDEIAEATRALFEDPGMLGNLPSAYYEAGLGPMGELDLDVDDDKVRADRLEHEARLMIAAKDFEAGLRLLDEAVAADSSRAEAVRSEFGFLAARGGSDDDDRDTDVAIWQILCANNWFVDIETLPVRSVSVSTEAAGGPEEHAGSERAQTGERAKRRRSGELLERAALELFRELFSLSPDEEHQLVGALRRQRSGTQFGHDLSVTWQVKGRPVRCHVECKHYRGPIRPRDVLEKLAQEKVSWETSRIDHWILISPHSSPSNDLQRMVELWDRSLEYPFKIQIWSPDTQVEEFFGLSAAIYDRVYGRRGPLAEHPSTWDAERRSQVVTRWAQRLRPHLRLEQPWREYLADPSRLCFSNEHPEETERIFRFHVQLRCTDSSGWLLPGTLLGHVRQWLQRKEQDTIVLLGEFGDGKSAFTYICSRILMGEYVENPSSGWLPFRIALRDFRSVSHAWQALERRLHEVGADLRSWRQLCLSTRLLVILDGFDEISVKLDPATEADNIRKLLECRRELGEFGNVKVMITSRARFFDERRNYQGLLEKLGSPERLYLAALPEAERLKHLERFATATDSVEKLRALQRIYDPLGLAAKPLFLEMIKTTLRDLPVEQLDQIGLYDVYITKGLTRKIEDLDADDIGVKRPDTVKNMKRILEELAVERALSDREYVALARFRGTGDETLAQLLWQIAIGDAEDARARIGVRSVLTVVRGANAAEWPVDFFHRSVREYFIGCAIVRAMLAGPDASVGLLSKLPVQREVLEFAAALAKRRDADIAPRLLELARSQPAGSGESYLSGNAASMLFRMVGVLPGDDWRNLNLDYVQLPGAELSGKRFEGSTLRSATLQNANLENADLRHCDLRGVKLEETTVVEALATVGRDRIVVAYGDGTIREWHLESASGAECRRLVDEVGVRVDTVAIIGRASLVTIGRDVERRYHVNLWRRRDSGWSVVAKYPVREQYSVAGLGGQRMLIADSRTHTMSLIDLTGPEVLVKEMGVAAAAAAAGLGDKGIVVRQSLGGIGISLASGERVGVRAEGVTHIATHRLGDGDAWLVAGGGLDGRVRVWEVRRSAGALASTLRFDRPRHRGVVTGLAFLGDGLIVSGGEDRAVCVSVVTDEETPPRRLQLAVRCRGMKIDGVKGPDEYAMLAALLRQTMQAEGGEGAREAPGATP